MTVVAFRSPTTNSESRTCAKCDTPAAIVVPQSAKRWEVATFKSVWWERVVHEWITSAWNSWYSSIMVASGSSSLVETWAARILLMHERESLTWAGHQGMVVNVFGVTFPSNIVKMILKEPQTQKRSLGHARSDAFYCVQHIMSYPDDELQERHEQAVSVEIAGASKPFNAEDPEHYTRTFGNYLIAISSKTPCHALFSSNQSSPAQEKQRGQHCSRETQSSNITDDLLCTCWWQATESHTQQEKILVTASKSSISEYITCEGRGPSHIWTLHQTARSGSWHKNLNF